MSDTHEVRGAKPRLPTKNKAMSKLDKKKLKLQERIKYLEDELVLSLTKKTSDTKEIDVAGHQRKIADLRKELLILK